MFIEHILVLKGVEYVLFKEMAGGYHPRLIRSMILWTIKTTKTRVDES